MAQTSYWKSVRAEALSETKIRIKANPGWAMSAVVAAVLGIFALWFFIGENAAKEDVIPKLVATAVIVATVAWMYLSKLIEIPARRDGAKERELALLRYQIDKSSGPERISLVDFAKLAEQDFGWDFSAGWQTLDLVTGLKHAANDGLLHLEGKRAPWLPSLPIDPFRRNQILFEPVVRKQWRTYDLAIVVPGLSFSNTDNFDVSISGFADDAPKYHDVHVSDRNAAISWLRLRGSRVKGQSEAWYEEGETERRKIFGPAEIGAPSDDNENS